MIVLRNLDLLKLNFLNKIKKKIVCLLKDTNIFSLRRKLKISILILSIFIPVTIQKQLLSDTKNIEVDVEKNRINWKKLNSDKQNKEKVIWK